MCVIYVSSKVVFLKDVIIKCLYFCGYVMCNNRCNTEGLCLLPTQFNNVLMILRINSRCYCKHNLPVGLCNGHGPCSLLGMNKIFI
jgi:hypothetical protein